MLTTNTNMPAVITRLSISRSERSDVIDGGTCVRKCTKDGLLVYEAVQFGRRFGRLYAHRTNYTESHPRRPLWNIQTLYNARNLHVYARRCWKWQRQGKVLHADRNLVGNTAWLGAGPEFLTFLHGRTHRVRSATRRTLVVNFIPWLLCPQLKYPQYGEVPQLFWMLWKKQKLLPLSGLETRFLFPS